MRTDLLNRISSMSGFRKTLLLFGFVLLATAALVAVVKLDFSKPVQEEQIAITSLAILELMRLLLDEERLAASGVLGEIGG